MYIYVIHNSDIFACVKDSGSDVKRPFRIMLDSKWEWCVPNMLNCTLVKGFGARFYKYKSKNTSLVKSLKIKKGIGALKSLQNGNN